MQQFCILKFAISSYQRVILPLGLMLLLYSCVPAMAEIQDGRSLDGQSRAGQGGADLSEQLQRELGAAAEKEDDNPLLNIARAMFQVRQRMTQTDAGPATLNLQKQIVADLDQLIDQARKSAGQCSPSASNRQQPSAQNPAASPRSKSGTGVNQKPSNKPATASSPRPPGSQPRKPDMDEMRLIMKDLWGELPPHVREQMLQTPVEEFIPKYQQLIEDYFRELSDEKRGDGD